MKRRTTSYHFTYNYQTQTMLSHKGAYHFPDAQTGARYTASLIHAIEKQASKAPQQLIQSHN